MSLEKTAESFIVKINRLCNKQSQINDYYYHSVVKSCFVEFLEDTHKDLERVFRMGHFSSLTLDFKRLNKVISPTYKIENKIVKKFEVGSWSQRLFAEFACKHFNRAFSSLNYDFIATKSFQTLEDFNPYFYETPRQEISRISLPNPSFSIDLNI